MKKITFNSHFLLCALLLVVALGTRWFDIDRFGLWSDELGSVFYASALQNTVQDIHTPFFYLLSYFGLNSFGVNELGMRVASLLASSLLLVFLFYQAVTRDKNRWTWFFVVFSFSSLDWALSREARMYEWMILFSTLSFLSGHQFLSSSSSRSFKNWGVLTLLMGLNGFNHVSALIFNASCVLYWSFRKKSLVLGKLSLSTSFLISSLPVLIYYLSADRLDHAFSRIHWIRSLTGSWPWDLWRHLMGAKHPYLEFQSDFYPLLLLFALLFLCAFCLWKKYSLKWCTPLLIVLFYHLGQLTLLPFLNLFHIRYFSALLPIILWVVALGLERVLTIKKLNIFAVVSFLLVVQVLGLKAYAPQAGLREFYQSALVSKSNEQVVICDYALMKNSQKIFYPELVADAVYCYDFVRYYFEASHPPKNLKVVSSLNYSEDFKAIEDFLSQNYELKKVDSGPGEAGRIWYYARR